MNTLLQNYLDGDDNIHGLDFVATEGFLTAQVINPSRNPLDLLFEGKVDTVPKVVLDALVSWQDTIKARLEDESLTPSWLEQEGSLDLSDAGDATAWCAGFVAGMNDERAHWFIDDEAHDDEVGYLTLPMLIIGGVFDEDAQDLLALSKDEDALVALAGSINENLAELYLIFQEAH